MSDLTENPFTRQGDRLPRQDELADFKGTLTHANLEQAYAVDSKASQLYLYFARIARIEGYPEVAQTLAELAESQTLYAHGHLDFLKRAGDPVTGLPVGETLLNLRAAISAESQESAAPLPEMAKTAHAEGFPDIASWFENLAKVRRAHASRLENALSIAQQDAR